MKNNFLYALLLFSFFGYSQTCNYNEAYSSANGWTTVDLSPNGLPFTGATPRINISNGTLNFVATADGSSDTRMYEQLSSPLCDSWVAEFDFIITGVGDGNDNRTVAHPILAITANRSQPLRETTGAVTNNDGIMVYLYNHNGTNSPDMAFRVIAKNGTTNSGILGLSPQVFLNVNYRIILERIQGVNGRITIINTDTDTELYSDCFDIPDGIENLSYIQHSNNPGGSATRILSGRIDNTCIRDCYQVDDCCLDDEIIGLPFICSTSGFAEAPNYSVTNNSGVDYNWIVSGATFTGQGTNSINLVIPTGFTGTVNIVLEMTCGCVTTTLTKTVTVYADLSNETSFSSTITTTISGTNEIVATAFSTLTGITHTWELYEGADCTDNSEPILNPNSPVLIASGTGANFTFTGLTPPGTCYVIKHIVSYDGGLCEEEERRNLLSSESVSGGEEGGQANERSNNGKISFSKTGEEIQIFPNPSSGEFTVFVKNSDSFQFQVYDMSGKIIRSGVSLQSQSNINLSEYKDGLYTIQIMEANGTTHRKQVSLDK
jgi:hypothetical protein